MSAGRRLGVLVALVVGALTAGCGVPSHTDVRVDGPIQEAGAPASGEGAASPPGPDDASTEEELVNNFLQAAAGDPGDPVERLRGFVHSDQRGRWEPDPRIVVVRELGDTVPTLTGDGSSRVRISVQELGVLTAEGAIEPMPGARKRDVEFQVVPELAVTEGLGVNAEDPTLRIVDPPNVIMLSADALEAGYLLPRPVYFWDSEGNELVPDLRWLPSALADRQRAQSALDWLVEGPAPWLDGATAGLPEDVALDGNVVWSDDHLEVGLTAAAADVDPGRLEAQLWWTLRPELAGNRTLVLEIDGREREVADYPFANPAVREPPASFAVVDGVIRQYRPDTPRLELPALSEEVNADVHNAALTRDGRNAALVKARDDGLLRLELTRPGGRTTTDLRAVTMSRPLWLASRQVGLIVADGDLYRFQAGGEGVDRVPVPGDLDGTITAVAAAPDGHRLALVAGGRLYVASMTGREDSLVTVNEPRLLPTTATGDLKGVGFIRENWLIVVGPDTGGSQLRLYEITMDGAYELAPPLGELGTFSEIGNVVSYPADPSAPAADPSTPQQHDDVLYEAEGRAYAHGYEGELEQILASDMIDAPEDATDLRAPFYQD